MRARVCACVGWGWDGVVGTFAKCLRCSKFSSFLFLHHDDNALLISMFHCELSVDMCGCQKYKIAGFCYGLFLSVSCIVYKMYIQYIHIPLLRHIIHLERYRQNWSQWVHLPLGSGIVTVLLFTVYHLPFNPHSPNLRSSVMSTHTNLSVHTHPFRMLFPP